IKKHIDDILIGTGVITYFTTGIVLFYSIMTIENTKQNQYLQNNHKQYSELKSIDKKIVIPTAALVLMGLSGIPTYFGLRNKARKKYGRDIN
ncbi:MAG: hypothetical protein QXG00_06500, partial [Candidatus Woesearchaeota archaeon]